MADGSSTLVAETGRAKPAIPDWPGATDVPRPRRPIVSLTDDERSVLQRLDDALADGVALKVWWERTEKSGSYAERLELARTFNRPDRGIGFFDQVPVRGREIAVMGVVQEMPFDQPRSASPEEVRAEVREFVLRYMMRVSDYREPEPWLDPHSGADQTRPWPSWCPRPSVERRGFGFSQLFYKLRGPGQVGQFIEREQYSIVDLREVGPTYEWVLGRVEIFNFNLRFRPFGANFVAVEYPLEEDGYIAIAPDFVVDRQDPEPGVIGRYGFGYALIRSARRRGLVDYGPGQFNAGFQLVQFDVLDSGATRIKMVFVANRPERILRVPIDPVRWGFAIADVFSLGLASRVLAGMRPRRSAAVDDRFGFDPVGLGIALANLGTAGYAADSWCISMRQLEQEFLLHHFMQHYRMAVGANLTWHYVNDWLDEANLPRWAITGVSS